MSQLVTLMMFCTKSHKYKSSIANVKKFQKYVLVFNGNVVMVPIRENGGLAPYGWSMQDSIEQRPNGTASEIDYSMTSRFIQTNQSMTKTVLLISAKYYYLWYLSMNTCALKSNKVV